MRLIVLLLALLVSSDAFAGSNTIGMSRGIRSYTTSVSERTFNICLAPDGQNQSSMSDLGTTPGNNCSQPVGAFCTTGASCTRSPYCDTTWWNTGAILLRNQAYSMTGQWEKIDYSTVRGGDNVLSKVPHSLGPPKCNLIIGLGDAMDSCDHATPATATADQKHEYEMALNFWQIIKASGVPFFLVRGNHESEEMYDALITALGVEGLSYFYKIHTDRDQYAIKVPNFGGRTLCIMGVDYDGLGVDGTLTASEKTWLTTEMGCGGNYLSILAGHKIVGSDASATIQDTADTALASLIADAANDELFMLVGGHWTDATPISRKVATTNGAAHALFKFFSDVQEMDRHSQNRGGSGITSSDANGGVYTVITIHPGSDFISAYDWNPYWQTRSSLTNGQDFGAEFMSEYGAAFDYDAR